MLKPNMKKSGKNSSQESSKNQLNDKFEMKKVFQYGERESMAYLASIFPRQFGICDRVFNDIKEKCKHFHPKNILDYGCGPGTGFLSACKHWDISEVLAVDISLPMLKIAGDIHQSNT
jgi:ribosomal protein RSM22 (predicted rRNA methylase)